MDSTPKQTQIAKKDRSGKDECGYMSGSAVAECGSYPPDKYQPSCLFAYDSNEVEENSEDEVKMEVDPEEARLDPLDAPVAMDIDFFEVVHKEAEHVFSPPPDSPFPIWFTLDYRLLSFFTRTAYTHTEARFWRRYDSKSNFNIILTIRKYEQLFPAHKPYILLNWREVLELMKMKPTNRKTRSAVSWPRREQQSFSIYYQLNKVKLVKKYYKFNEKKGYDDVFKAHTINISYHEFRSLYDYLNEKIVKEDGIFQFEIPIDYENNHEFETE